MTPTDLHAAVHAAVTARLERPHRCYCGETTACTLRWPGPCSVYLHGHRCVNPPDMPHQCACGATT